MPDRPYTPPPQHPPQTSPQAQRRGLMPEPASVKPWALVSMEEITGGWLVAVDGDPILRFAPKSFSRQTIIRAARDGLLRPFDPPDPVPKESLFTRRTLTILGLAFVAAFIGVIALAVFVVTK